MYRIELDRFATRDIATIVDWLSNKLSPEKLLEWLDNLQQTIKSLENFPERCPLAPENGKYGEEKLHQLLFTDYPSVYRIIFVIRNDNNLVRVLQVRHGARRYDFEQ